MIKNTFYVVLFLVGLSSLYSCQEKIEQALPSETKTEELSLENLSKNPEFVAYTEANIKFLNDYHAWYNTLEASERAIYDKKIANALENHISEDLAPAHISSKEFAIYQKQQKARVSAIMVKYPELRKMENNYKFIEKAIKSTISAKNLHYSYGNKNARTEEDCFAGYNACSWYMFDTGGDVDGCYVGYLSCINS